MELLKIRLLFVVVSVIVLSACSALGFDREGHIESVESIAGDHEIVGVWEWDNRSTYIYIFNSDGYGSRGSSPTIQRFSWEIIDNRLNMTVGRVEELWYWEIENDTLTITSRQARNMQYSYNRR